MSNDQEKNEAYWRQQLTDEEFNICRKRALSQNSLGNTVMRKLLELICVVVVANQCFIQPINMTPVLDGRVFISL